MAWKKSIVAFLTSLVISFIICIVLNDFGITWDEPIHFGNADQYIAWLKKPDWGSKEAFFKPTTSDVHPPFRKLVAGITHEALTNRLHIIDNTRGYRISSLLFVLPFVFVFTYVAIGFVGYVLGVLAACIISFLPHVLFLTPLVTMDYSIMVLWFFAVIFGVKAVRSWRFQILCGICIGLTMLTKLHGFLLFLPIGIYWAYTNRLQFKKRLWKKIFRLALPLVVIVVTAFFVYFLGWPWLWSQPVHHLQEYFQIQLQHDSVPVYIFGTIYDRVPWWYVPVMFVATTPLFVLIFFISGCWSAVKRGSDTAKLYFVNAILPMALFMLPFMYRYDWVRLFLPAFPFVVLIAVLGMKVIAEHANKKNRYLILLGLIVCWIGVLWYSVIRIHPWESSYYSGTVGGIRGAYIRGFETDYWVNSYKGILPWMNANKKNMMCVYPTTHPFYYYQAMGQIEGGVVFTATGDACKYLIVSMRQGHFARVPDVAKIVKEKKPIYVVTLDGVIIVAAYDISNVK